MKYTDAHRFALYVDGLSNIAKQNKTEFAYKEKALYQRITKVLRLQKNERCILFDNHIHITLELAPEMFTSKNTISGTISAWEKNKSLYPRIILCPSLVQKHFFENIVYSAAQMGVQTIIPIITQKVKRNWLAEKEKARLNKIMVAACEQAKQFIIPTLHDPISFENFVKAPDKTYQNVFFDTGETPLIDLLLKLDNSKLKAIRLFFGPEGGNYGQRKNRFTKKQLCRLYTHPYYFAGS